MVVSKREEGEHGLLRRNRGKGAAAPTAKPQGGERPACGGAQSGVNTHFELNICYIGYIILYYNIYYRIYFEIYIKYIL